MDKHLLDEIIGCLPKERTLLRYAWDDYALILPSRFAGGGISSTPWRGFTWMLILKQMSVDRRGADGLAA